MKNKEKLRKTKGPLKKHKSHQKYQKEILGRTLFLDELEMSSVYAHIKVVVAFLVVNFFAFLS